MRGTAALTPRRDNPLTHISAPTTVLCSVDTNIGTENGTDPLHATGENIDPIDLAIAIVTISVVLEALVLVPMLRTLSAMMTTMTMMPIEMNIEVDMAAETGIDHHLHGTKESETGIETTTIIGAVELMVFAEVEEASLRVSLLTQ